ncbi:Inner membrane transport protein YajR [hydrothermal vent metagenome]|uniref:Inner membrane transport protein YajR n=1 Tax=hydrothermal vent metagenome TaxID=652676 RepID=A0A3B0YQ06_9ZZZZ
MSQNLDAAAGMSRNEVRSAASMASIYALRMLGLFMILPVFALYAGDLEGATPVLAGLAIGIYGLTQAVLQIPFGLVSDHIGRKPVIIFGLLLFASGSVLAATADSMLVVIFGRALQGAGAIAAAVMALTADLVREEHRVKAMAIIGMSIGGAFALSMVLGPILNGWIGVPGIFWLTAALAIAAIAVVILLVPNPVVSRVRRDAETVPAQITSVLRDSQLLRIDLGIFCLHLILTASFVVLPLALRDVAGLPGDDHWMLYLPVLGLSLPMAIPFILQAEKYRRMKPVFVSAIAVIALAQGALSIFHASVFAIGMLVFVYFTAFNLLEAILPSLVAKTAPPDRKGTAMGVYSSCQFFGAFVGGAAGGLLHGLYGLGAVFLLCSLVALVWLILAGSMQRPHYLVTRLLRVGPQDSASAHDLAEQISAVRGVTEVVVIPEDQIAYLKIDQQVLDEDGLLVFSVPASGE